MVRGRYASPGPTAGVSVIVRVPQIWRRHTVAAGVPIHSAALIPVPSSPRMPVPLNISSLT